MKSKLIGIVIIFLTFTCCNNRVIADFEITNNTGMIEKIEEIDEIEEIKIEPNKAIFYLVNNER